jgi:hypothetical protein
MKPTLKALGTWRLKLEYDGVVSSFASNFNLRRYMKGGLKPDGTQVEMDRPADLLVYEAGLGRCTSYPDSDSS